MASRSPWISRLRVSVPDSCPIQNLIVAVSSLRQELRTNAFLSAITVRTAQHETVFREEWAEAEREGIQFEYVDYDKLVR